MNTRRRGGLCVRGRKKKAKVCLGKKENNAMRASSSSSSSSSSASSSSLQRKLKELQRTVPGSHGGMDVQAMFQGVQNYIVLLEAKVRILRSLTTFYGV